MKPTILIGSQVDSKLVIKVEAFMFNTFDLIPLSVIFKTVDGT